MVVNDKSWQCPRCNWKSSQRWNMVRHIKLRHNASLSPVRPQGFPSRKLDIDGILNNTGMDKSRDPLTELLEWMQNYYTSVKSLGLIHTQPKVPPSAPLYPKPFKNTSPNYWILPIADIQGISGYFCRQDPFEIWVTTRLKNAGIMNYMTMLP
jgi:hypothetical protein